MLFSVKPFTKNRDTKNFTQTMVLILTRKVRMDIKYTFCLQLSFFLLVYVLAGKPNSKHDSADGEEDGT